MCEWAVRLDYHARLDRPCAGCHGLRGALDFDQAHSAIAGNHEFFVVAVAGDRDAGLLAGLDEGGAGCEEYALAGTSSSIYARSGVRTLDGDLAAIDGELDLGVPCGTRGEGARRLGGGIEGGLCGRAAQRAQQVLPHHVASLAAGSLKTEGREGAEISRSHWRVCSQQQW